MAVLNVMANNPAEAGDSEFIQFRNEVLAPKFIRFRHILVDGLTSQSRTGGQNCQGDAAASRGEPCCPPFRQTVFQSVVP